MPAKLPYVPVHFPEESTNGAAVGKTVRYQFLLAYEPDFCS